MPGETIGCGIDSAAKVRSAAGFKLSQSFFMDCGTASALKKWIDRSAKPALSRKGGGLAGICAAVHYTCRLRSNQKGAKISEHGRGRAIDIALRVFV